MSKKKFIELVKTLDENSLLSKMNTYISCASLGEQTQDRNRYSLYLSNNDGYIFEWFDEYSKKYGSTNLVKMLTYFYLVQTMGDNNLDIAKFKFADTLEIVKPDNNLVESNNSTIVEEVVEETKFKPRKEMREQNKSEVLNSDIDGQLDSRLMKMLNSVS